MKYILFLFTILSIQSCQQQVQVDLIVTNANVYTVNESFDNAEAFAIKDGKFVNVGSTEAIISKYQATNSIDAEKQTIVPGFIDAHCHFLTLGQLQQQVNLVGTTSFDDMIKRVIE
jgi:predicted amidohydrolase YtcJ